jgi:fructose-specific phosphotransferase system IIA component
MILGQFIGQDFIVTQLASVKKSEVIEELIDCFVQNGVVTDKGQFKKTIEEREKLQSTGIGGGVAIPHGRSDSVRELKVVFGRSVAGIDFEALDDQPVHLIFMIAAPKKIHREYLQIVAKIARLLKSKVMRQALLKANTTREVIELIRDFDNVLVEDVQVKTKDGRVLYGE